MISTIVNWLQSIEGWKRGGVLVVLGALTSLCQAPYDLSPLLWLTFPALIWIFDSVKRNENNNISIKSAFATGWFFGFGYYAASSWWLALPFLVQPEKHGWMAPFVNILAPSLFAIYWGVVTAIVSKFWYPDWRRILVFSIAISLMEFIKAHLFSGFPWAAIGYSFLDAWVLGQFAAIFGLYGLNFLAILIFSAPAALIRTDYSVKRGGSYLNGFTILCLIIMVSFGLYRLSPSQAVPDTEYLVRVVQPNISQKEKWNPENRDKIYETFREMSRGTQTTSPTENSKPTIVVFPEAALPLQVRPNVTIVGQLIDMVPKNHYLITGAVRGEFRDNKPLFYNSVFALDSKGKILDFYDKVHLVPLGEYMPFPSILEKFNIHALVQHYTGLVAGEVRKELKIPGVPNSAPLVCYEIIFPGRVLPETAEADWIVNVTNDSWLGDTGGSYQHFDQARMRAIEEGVPIVRAANTGISAIVDANGIIRKQLKINEPGVIEDYLPATKSTEMFAVTRKYGHFAMVIVAGLLIFGTSKLRTKNSSKTFNIIDENS